MASRMATVRRDDASKLLDHLREKGVRLWLSEGQLRYRAPRGLLAPTEIERIREYREEVVDLMQPDPEAAPASASSAATHDAPLTFSQLQHWNFYELSRQKALRHLTNALRLQGDVDVGRLERSLVEVVRRHEALRTQIVVHAGQPKQRVYATRKIPFKPVDLGSVLPQLHQDEIEKNLQEMVLLPVDIAIDPLWEVRLLRLAREQHVLLIVMDHIISDMWSIDVFIRDLFAVYGQLGSTSEATLPEVPVQMSEYAVWQHEQHPRWLAKHGDYWERRLRGCERLRFADDAQSGEVLGRGWGAMPVALDGSLRTRLQQWSKETKTTMVMGVFAAYIAAVFRWCNICDGIVRFESNGRINQQVERTIGYFTTPLYLRIAIHESDRIADLIARVSAEYCSANEHADSAYIESRMPRFEFTRNPAFNWIPQLGQLIVPASGDAEQALACSTLEIENPRLRELQRDTEPFAIFFDRGEHIEAAIWYPRDRFLEQTMRGFAEHFLRFIQALVAQPDRRLAEVSAML